MKMRSVLLVGATFIVYSLANASSVDPSEPGNYQDFKRGHQSYNNCASLEISGTPMYPEMD